MLLALLAAHHAIHPISNDIKKEINIKKYINIKHDAQIVQVTQQHHIVCICPSCPLPLCSLLCHSAAYHVLVRLYCF